MVSTDTFSLSLPPRQESPFRTSGSLDRCARGQFLGHLHQLGEGFGLHFFHDFAAVGFDGDFTDAQFRANLFVQQAGDDQVHDFALAGSDGRQAAAGVAESRFAGRGWIWLRSMA